jgi:hypothetical protein
MSLVLDTHGFVLVMYPSHRLPPVHLMIRAD